MDILKEHSMLKKTAISDIYSINDSSGAKISFAKRISKINNYKLFTGFIALFKEIDNLTGMSGEVDYKE
jgi:hypothetical protein